MKYSYALIILACGISIYSINSMSESFAEVECSPIDLKYSINGGTVTNICKNIDGRTVKLNLVGNDIGGNITMTVPKKYTVSLESMDCRTGPPIFIMDENEITPSKIKEKNSDFVISIDFTNGNHTLILASSEIIPSPSPSMLCGVVLGYDSQFLPPRIQTERGVELRFIQCNDTYQLVVRYDGSPACVKPENKSEFLKRGWEEPQNHTVFSQKQVFFSKYAIDYDDLIVRDTSMIVYKTTKNFPNKNCFTLTEKDIEEFPDNFLDTLKEAEDEQFLPRSETYPPGVYTGYGMSVKKDLAFDLLKKYQFSVDMQMHDENVLELADYEYLFDCFFAYEAKQYLMRLNFENQLGLDGIPVHVTITQENSKQPILLNDNIVVYYGGFNNTVLFHNDLNYEITLSTDDPIVNFVDEDDGDIHENKFAKKLSESKAVIPPGKFIAYTFSPYTDKEDSPINYRIKPLDLAGQVTVKMYPRCMTTEEVKSLYNMVKVYPKFPSYLPDGYSFECGVENTNAFVHFTYFTDELRQKFEDKVNAAFNRDFLSEGGLVVDYFDEAENGWIEDPLYDKFEKAKENAANPQAKTLTISGEPAVMVNEYYWKDGKLLSFNRLEVFLDEEQIRLKSGIEESELVKIAESFFDSPMSEQNSIPKWKIPEELSKIGCTGTMVDHLKQYSNAFDEKWYGEGVAIEDIGLPWGVHQYALDQCMQNISELRDSEMYGCEENEIYFRGICMTQETKEKAQSIGEKETEN